MISARKPTNERERLNALRGYEILDTEAEAAFDAMTRVAATVCRVPIALITLIDDERQWFKSQCGMPGVSSTGRNVSFCAHAILQSGLFEIPDAREDVRFADNPLVTGDPHIRFYAGVPLVEPGGMALGTLCVIDRKPRTLTKRQRLQLEDVAQSVVGLILMRLRRSELDEYRQARIDNDEACARLKEHSERLERLATAKPAVA